MANFEALPFCVVSDDETETTETTDSAQAHIPVVELTHTGPNTRKLKPPIATVG